MRNKRVNVFKDCKQIVIKDKLTNEILAIIEPDGKILSPVYIQVSFNYKEPEYFTVIGGD